MSAAVRSRVRPMRAEEKVNGQERTEADPPMLVRRCSAGENLPQISRCSSSDYASHSAMEMDKAEISLPPAHNT